MEELLLSGYMLSLFFQVVPITCLVGGFYLILRYRRLKTCGEEVRWGRELLRLLFICYLTGLVNLVLVPNNLWTAIWSYVFRGHSGCEVGPLFQFSANWVPTVWRWLRGELTVGGWVRTMLVGNVLMFVPMGLFLRLLPQGSGHRRTIVSAALAIPILIELLQPIVGRSFDVDDILGNFMGILLGYLLTVAAQAGMKKWKR